MAAFVAKQMMGNKLNAVKGQMGGDDDGGGGTDKEAEELAEQERLEALREIEEKRKEKHRKMEEEREEMRQGIRDKYGIQKKQEPTEETLDMDMDSGGGLNRKKKTPEELAKEAELEDQDDFTKLKGTLESQVNVIKESIEGKCVLQ